MQRRLLCLLSLALLLFGQPFAVRAIACAVRACPMAITTPSPSAASIAEVAVAPQRAVHRCCPREFRTAISQIIAGDQSGSCCCRGSESSAQQANSDWWVRTAEAREDSADPDAVLPLSRIVSLPVADSPVRGAILIASDGSPPRDPFRTLPPSRAPPVLRSLRLS
ncbi:MAG: hypothetical protein SFX74_11085 [Fimbriimonadaceae bacterium]|nr:hypothetical protein [Fimbriimonadaceae bacterium]